MGEGENAGHDRVGDDVAGGDGRGNHGHEEGEPANDEAGEVDGEEHPPGEVDVGALALVDVLAQGREDHDEGGADGGEDDEVAHEVEVGEGLLLDGHVEEVPDLLRETVVDLEVER